MDDKTPKQKAREAALVVTRWIGSLESILLHTIAFVISFAAVLAGEISFDRMLLVLTTIVSLEAIYLAIFIQMTINYASEDLEEVEHDIDEIQEDLEEMSEGGVHGEADNKTLEEIRQSLHKLVEDVEHLQRNR
jgi:uncharacterized membrane protein (DUF106 family)